MMAHGTISQKITKDASLCIYGVMRRRSYQNVVISLRREFRYGVTTADEGLRPISPSKLKYPPHPSGRRYQTN